MVISSPPRPLEPQFVLIDITSLRAGKPPLVDLYHLVDHQYVLYCEARSVFTEEARRRLVDNGVRGLYTRVAPNGGVECDVPLQDVLALPDSQVPPLAKAGLLYNSAVATAQMVFIAPDLPESMVAARRLAGSIAVRATQNPGCFQVLLRLMRHDFSVYSHAVNTCCYAVALGSFVDLGHEDLLDLSLAAFLHDVGKLKVPRSILEKPSSLTPREWAKVRPHPKWSVQLLEGNGLKWSVERTILQHHERLDGSGYPWGLRGAQIHPLSRMIALADAYDALTSERPYRPRLSPLKALRVIKDEMAGQFDRDLFVALVHALGRGATDESAEQTLELAHPEWGDRLGARTPCDLPTARALAGLTGDSAGTGFGQGRRSG